MTEIWAHRGASSDAPENTMAAFLRATQCGADGVEFDVQLSADGVPVVIHDETVDRTHGSEPLSRGRGGARSTWVGALSAIQLRGLVSLTGAAADTGIPTLDEVLDLLAASELIINIELKNSVVEYPGLEQKVLAAVAARDLAERVVLSSFNHYSLQLLRSLDGGCEVAAIYSDPLFKPWDYLAGLGVQAVHPPVAVLSDPEYVDRCHERGLKVRPWFSNDAVELGGLFQQGVDAVFTDDPRLALQVRSRT